MIYDPEWILANLDDMTEFSRENSMPQTARLLQEAKHVAELEIERANTTERRFASSRLEGVSDT